MIKDNNKDIIDLIYYELWTYFTPFSNIAEFEKVNVCWELQEIICWHPASNCLAFLGIGYAWYNTAYNIYDMIWHKQKSNT